MSDQDIERKTAERCATICWESDSELSARRAIREEFNLFPPKKVRKIMLVSNSEVPEDTIEFHHKDGRVDRFLRITDWPEND